MTIGIAPTARGVRSSVATVDADTKHFSTDHLLSDLEGRTISGTLVTVVSQFLQALLNVASVVVLARLLNPRDFGLVAMVTAVTNTLLIFRDAGLSAATVQTQAITHAQVSNLFWVNSAVGACLTLIVMTLSPLIARFYAEPRLVAIAVALSATFLLRGSTIQHVALLTRQMRFKAIAAIDICSMAAGLIVGIVMAIMSYGYWSLVGSALAIEGSRLVIAWVVSQWRPQLPARGTAIAGLLRFGASITAGGTLYFFARSVDLLLIGRRYGADSVGFYSRAMALFMRPMDQLLTPIGSVLMPALARLQVEPSRYRYVFLRCYETLALVGCIVGALCLPLAHPLTLVLLGQKWENAANIFAAFAIAAVYRPSSAAASWLLLSQARGRDFVLTNIISSISIVLSFFIGLPYGPFGVALSFSVSGLLVRLPILYHVIGRIGPVGVLDLWIGFVRHLPIWIVVCTATYLSYAHSSHNRPITQLIGSISVGLTAAIVTVLLVPRQRSLLVESVLAVRGVFGCNNIDSNSKR